MWICAIQLFQVTSCIGGNDCNKSKVAKQRLGNTCFNSEFNFQNSVQDAAAAVLHWLTSTTTAVHVTNKVDAENLLLELKVALKVSINRDNQARSNSSLEFPPSRCGHSRFHCCPSLTDTSGHPWCATLGDRLYKIFVSTMKKITPRQKNLGTASQTTHVT